MLLHASQQQKVSSHLYAMAASHSCFVWLPCLDWSCVPERSVEQILPRHRPFHPECCTRAGSGAVTDVARGRSLWEVQWLPSGTLRAPAIRVAAVAITALLCLLSKICFSSEFINSSC